jgi:hypothetical protein
MLNVDGKIKSDGEAKEKLRNGLTRGVFLL